MNAKTNEGFKALACCIIMQSLKDYRDSVISKGQLRSFARSEWFSQLCEISGLNIDPRDFVKNADVSNITVINAVIERGGVR